MRICKAEARVGAARASERGSQERRSPKDTIQTRREREERKKRETAYLLKTAGPRAWPKSVLAGEEGLHTAIWHRHIGERHTQKRETEETRTC